MKDFYPIFYEGHTTITSWLTKANKGEPPELTPQEAEERAMGKRERSCRKDCPCRNPIHLLQLFSSLQ